MGALLIYQGGGRTALHVPSSVWNYSKGHHQCTAVECNKSKCHHDSDQRRRPVVKSLNYSLGLIFIPALQVPGKIAFTCTDIRPHMTGHKWRRRIKSRLNWFGASPIFHYLQTETGLAAGRRRGRRRSSEGRPLQFDSIACQLNLHTISDGNWY